MNFNTSLQNKDFLALKAISKSFFSILLENILAANTFSRSILMKHSIVFLLFYTLSSLATDNNSLLKYIKSYQNKFPAAKSLTLPKLPAKNDYIFVDVRDEKEREVSSLPNSLNYEDWKQVKDSIGRIPVFYCTVGYRSSQMSDKWNKDGRTTFNLYGGIIHWINLGGKVIANGKEIRKVHTYSKDWAIYLQNKKYTAVY